MLKNLGDLCKPWMTGNGLPSVAALRLVQPDMSVREYSFDEIDALASQFANVLAQIGEDSGNVVAIFLSKCVEAAHDLERWRTAES